MRHESAQFDARSASRPVPYPPAFAQPLPAAAVRQALFNKEFVAFCQPKVSIDTGKLVGVEILARWDQPSLGLLSPLHFLPALEAQELLDELFRQMLDQALRIRRELRIYGCDLNLALNIHPMQLKQPGFAQEVELALKQRGCPPRALTLEVIETGAIEASGVSFRNLLQLRLMGCSLPMDDFGSGFSSLQRLCDLPFSEIKLDASFLRQLDSNAKTRAIIESTVKLANALKLKLVVEGVETRCQMQQLQALGCRTAQGFFFARPMPAEQFIGFCMMHNSTSDAVSL
ncbi:MAG: EAL domain-containing protein [Pseudomonas sp.]